MPPLNLSLIEFEPEPQKLDLTGIDFEDSTTAAVGQNVAEFFKGIPSGAVSLGGGALTGAAALTAASPRMREYVAEIQDIGPDAADRAADLRRRAMADPGLSASERQAVQAAISDVLEGTPPPTRADYAPTKERPLYRAGEAVKKAARGLLPAAPGYEESIGRQLGEGMGSMLGGAAASVAVGPLASGALFALAGAGEAVDNAVRAGATEAQIVEAARMGIVPGLTDSIPVETLTGRIPVPGVGFVTVPVGKIGTALKAAGRIGWQAFVEGIQEGGQKFLQNAISREVHTPGQSLTEGIVPEAGIGAGVGGIAEAGRQVLVGALGRRARPPGTREQATPPPLTQSDIDSPLPNDLIAEGQAMIADTEAIGSANGILSRAGAPPVGTRVGIDLGGGRVEPGTIVDAFTAEVPSIGSNDGVRVRLDSGREVDLTGQAVRNLRPLAFAAVFAPVPAGEGGAVPPAPAATGVAGAGPAAPEASLADVLTTAEREGRVGVVAPPGETPSPTANVSRETEAPDDQEGRQPVRRPIEDRQEPRRVEDQGAGEKAPRPSGILPPSEAGPRAAERLTPSETPPATPAVGPTAQTGAGVEPPAVPAQVTPGAPVSENVDDATGLPMNPDGTVTLFHGTTEDGATAIRKSGMLIGKEDGVFLTTDRDAAASFGGAVVPIRVKPERLQIDDEFPTGRKDFRIPTARIGDQVRVDVADEVDPFAIPEAVREDGGKPEAEAVTAKPVAKDPYEALFLDAVDRAVEEGGGWARIRNIKSGAASVWDLVRRGVLEENDGFVRRAADPAKAKMEYAKRLELQRSEDAKAEEVAAPAAVVSADVASVTLAEVLAGRRSARIGEVVSPTGARASLGVRRDASDPGTYSAVLDIDGKTQSVRMRFPGGMSMDELARRFEDYLNADVDGDANKTRVEISPVRKKEPAPKTVDDENRTRLAELKARRFKTAADEKMIGILDARIASDPSKWSVGQGVGYRVDRQINRGFRITKIDPETKMAVVRQVADTGLTVSGGTDRLADTRVHIADLVRDKKYDAAAPVEEPAPAAARKRDQGEMFSIGREGEAIRPDFDIDRVLADLTERLRAIDPKGRIALRLKETIESARTGKATAAHGRYLNRLIEVALSAAAKGEGTWVLNHEAIHGLRDIGVFRDAEWAALEKAALADETAMQEVRDRYAGQGLSEEALIEERVADMFADWAAQRKPAQGFVLRAFQRVRAFLKGLAASLRKAGYRTVEDIFEGVEAGKVGGREGAAERTAGERLSLRRDREPTLFDEADWSAPSERVWSWFSDRNLGTIERFKRGGKAAVDQAREKIQDRSLSLRRVQEAITRARNGTPLPENQDTYLAEELYYGRTGKRLDDFQRNRVEPMIAAIDAEKLSLDEVERYLYARHARERNEQIASINPEMPDGGSGMTTEAAAAVLDGFQTAGKTEALKRVAAMVDGIIGETMALRVSSGLMDAKTAETWRQTYEHYVPLRGFAEIDQNDAVEPAKPRTGRGFDVRGPESKRAFGRESEAADILANVISMHEEAIVRSEKNKVGKTFLRMVALNPNDAVWEINRVEYSPRINRETGMVEYGPDPTYTLRDNVVAVKVDGKVYHITIHHAGMARAMKNLGSESTNGLLRAMQRINRWLAFINTSSNPEFLISNFLRDAQTAGVNLQGVDEAKRLLGRILLDTPKAIRGAYQGVRGGEVAEWAKWYQEFARAGGKIEFFALDDIQTKRKKIEYLLKTLSPNALTRTMMAARAVEQSIQDVNSAVENGVRLATYANLRQRGVSEKKAASVARNLTVNFNRKGEWAGTMQALYLFYNASIQGSVRLLQAIRHPRVQKVVVGIIIANAMLDILNGLIAPDDDDGESKYDKISDWTRHHNMLVMNPLAADGTLDPIALKAPLPYGYNVFAVLGQKLGHAVRSGFGIGKKFDPLKAAMDVATVAVDSFNPMGAEESILKTIIPTVLKPYYELEVNRNFTGNPIMPEQNPFGPPKPDSERAFRTAPPAAKWFARTLNELTGGNPVRPGAVDISPETLEHWFQFTTGGAGTFVQRSGDLFYKIMAGKGDEVEWNTIPFARRLVEGNNRYYTQRRYYEIRDAAELAFAEYKAFTGAGDDAKASAVREKYGPELMLSAHAKGTSSLLDRVDRRLAGLRRNRRAAEVDKSLADDAKDERFKEIDEEIRRAQTIVIRLYNAEVRKKEGR